MFKWIRKFEYKTIAVRNIHVYWSDVDRRSSAAVIFKENGFGKKRVETQGCLWPLGFEEHPYWQKVVIPWRENVPFSEIIKNINVDNNVIQFSDYK